MTMYIIGAATMGIGVILGYALRDVAYEREETEETLKMISDIEETNGLNEEEISNE